MVKKQNGKKITINELAVMINNSFNNHTKLMMDGFDKMNERFGVVDKKFETVNGNFKKVFDVLEVMDDKIDDINSIKHRVDYIENVLSIQPAKQPVKK